jgi:hypothetical protein
MHESVAGTDEAELDGLPDLHRCGIGGRFDIPGNGTQSAASVAKHYLNCWPTSGRVHKDN